MIVITPPLCIFCLLYLEIPEQLIPFKNFLPVIDYNPFVPFYFHGNYFPLETCAAHIEDFYSTFPYISAFNVVKYYMTPSAKNIKSLFVRFQNLLRYLSPMLKQLLLELIADVHNLNCSNCCISSVIDSNPQSMA